MPLRDVIPIETRDETIVTAFDLNGVSDRGLIKIDALGLKTLSILRDATEIIKSTTGHTIDLDGLPLDDAETLEAFTRGDLVGVFQFDSPSAASLCRGVTFRTFDTIVAMTALDRPGTVRSGLARTYLERNADPTKVAAVHPVYDRITRDTLGVPVYQEHVIKLCRELGGFTPEEADKIRKLIGKSKGAGALAVFGDKFIDGATARGMGRDRARELWGDLCEFGGYSFNKSHATAYSMIAYTTQYLKTHHALAFFAALIKNEKQEKILSLVKEAEARGIPVVLPNVQSAGVAYRVVKGAIVPSLVDIKFASTKAAIAIEKAQPFTDLVDCIKRARDANKRVVESLIKAGAMRDLVPNTKLGLEYLDKLWPLRDTDAGREKIRKFIAATKGRPDYDDEKLDAVAAEVNPFVIVTHPIEKAADVIRRTVKVKPIKPDLVAKIDDGFYLGAVTECKVSEYNNGDGKGVRRSALLVLDGGGVKPFKVKLGEDQFAARDLDKLVDDIVVVHYRRSYKVPSAQFVVSVSELDNKLRQGKTLSPWDLIVRRELPRGARILANVKTILDKNNHEMAFVTVMGPSKAVEGVVFSSTWLDIRKGLKPGRAVKVSIKTEMRQGKKSVIFRQIKPVSFP
jgi:DNA polymerase III alpha subunit